MKKLIVAAIAAFAIQNAAADEIWFRSLVSVDLSDLDVNQFDQAAYVSANTDKDGNYWCNLSSNCNISDLTGFGGPMSYVVTDANWTNGEHLISWFRNDASISNPAHLTVIQFEGASQADADAFKYLEAADIDNSIQVNLIPNSAMDIESFFPLLNIINRGEVQRAVINFRQENYVITDATVFEGFYPELFNNTGQVIFEDITAIITKASSSSIFCQGVQAGAILISDYSSGSSVNLNSGDAFAALCQ